MEKGIEKNPFIFAKGCLHMISTPTFINTADNAFFLII